MKRTLILLVLALSFVVSSRAQSTTVSATVTDSDGTVWANGTCSAAYQPVPGFPGPLVNAVNGQVLSNPVSCALNGSGSFSTLLVPTASVLGPSNRHSPGVTFTVCPGFVGSCYTTPVIVISGASQSVTTQINAAIVAPRVTSTLPAQAYNDTEAVATPGNQYFNVTSATFRCYTNAWAACGGSVSSGFPITLGTTSIASGSTTTTLSGLTLTNAIGSKTAPSYSYAGNTNYGWYFRSGVQELAEGGAAVVQVGTSSVVVGNSTTPSVQFAPGDVSTTSPDTILTRSASGTLKLGSTLGGVDGTLDLGGANLSTLTASELVQTDSSKNLISTTALPNGTTATTQTTGDNTTKIATDAFVIANAGGAGDIVFVAPSGDTTGATDVTNISTAYGSGKKLVWLETSTGPFYLNATTSMSNPGWIECDGPGSNPIELVGTTMYAFTLSWSTAGGWTTNTQAGGVRNCQIAEKSGVTPTAGGAFLIGTNSAGNYTRGVHIENNVINNVWRCFTVQTGQISNWTTNNVCDSPVSSNSPPDGYMLYSTAAPGGDDHFTADEARGSSGGLVITQSDRTAFEHIKLNGAGVTFTQAGSTKNMLFDGVSFEGASGSPSCGVDFGTGSNEPVGIQFIGSEVGYFGSAFCHASTAFSDGTAELEGVIVPFGGNLTQQIATFPPYMYNIGQFNSNCGTYQVQDLFYGSSSLQAHMTNCAQTWFSYGSISGNTGTLTVNAGTLVGSASGDYYVSMTPQSANYTVTMVCTNSSTSVCKALGRMSTSAYTEYEAAWISGTGVQLYKIVAGTATQEGTCSGTCSGQTYTGITSGTHTIAIAMTGSSTTSITVTVDGTSVITFSDTSSPITAAGVPGLGISNVNAIISSLTVQ